MWVRDMITFKKQTIKLGIVWRVFWKTILSCLHDVIVYEIWAYGLKRILKPNKNTLQIHVKLHGECFKISMSDYNKDNYDAGEIALYIYNQLREMDIKETKKKG